MSENLSSVPLCVDLDGTLLKTDMLYESFIRLIRLQPWCLFLFPVWLIKGKANLKAKIAERVDLTDIVLPFNDDVVKFVSDERTKRPTVLLTGTTQSIANVVASQCDIFDEVQGSSTQVNLTGQNKTYWLLEKYGEKNFDYIGNEKADLPVWETARKAHVVSTKNGISETVGRDFSEKFLIEKPSWKDYLSLIRIHQWSKNALVFVPFLLEYKFNDLNAALVVVLAFLAMCFLASATYIINDMLDLSVDRQNSTKKKRVLASGRISILQGFKVMLILLALTVVLMFFLPWKLDVLLLCYLIFTLTYSFFLKQKAILDIISIAALHTLRVIAGTVAVQTQWSFWLLAFSMFLLFSLATAKRVAELTNLNSSNRKHAIGRDYQVADIPLLIATGVSTGYISVLVVALYINSSKVQELYTQPVILWFLCPVLMYWIGRIWLKTSRGGLHEDPIIFAIRDRTSWFTVAVLATTVIAAKYMTII